MLPPIRRSWALRGHPPVLLYKSGHREKVSIVAAFCLTPGCDRLGLAYQTLKNGYFDNRGVAVFLERLLAEVGALIVIWDGGSMHKGDPIRHLEHRSRGRLIIEPLPAQAAELMPVEQLWMWLKHGQLCNFAPENATQLERLARQRLRTIGKDEQMLRRLFQASALPAPRALLR